MLYKGIQDLHNSIYIFLIGGIARGQTVQTKFPHAKNGFAHIVHVNEFTLYTYTVQYINIMYIYIN